MINGKAQYKLFILLNIKLNLLFSKNILISVHAEHYALHTKYYMYVASLTLKQLCCLTVSVKNI